MSGPTLPSAGQVGGEDRPIYSVVIPVYNSDDSLSELVERLECVFRDEIRDSFEIVMVDDASPNPRTWPSLEALAASHPSVRAIQLMRNSGRHSAVSCGFHHARGQWIITMDDDLQHRPEDIAAFVPQREHDVVIGAFAHKHHSWFKRTASRINGWFDTKLAGKPQHIQSGPFMMIRAQVLAAMNAIRSPYPYISVLVFQVTRDVVNVNVHHDPRKHGATQFTLRKMLQLFTIMLLHSSPVLLSVVAATGIGVSLLSMAYGVFVIVQHVVSDIVVPGWASLTVLLSFQGGLILLSLGVIGEYLVRILNGIEMKPAFVVRKVLGGEGDADG